jgi:hypothetical protein
VLVQAQRVAARIHSAHRGRLDAVPVLHRPNLVSVSRRLRVTRRLIYFQDGMSTKCNQFQNVLRFVRGHHPSAWVSSGANQREGPLWRKIANDRFGSQAASQETDWVKPRPYKSLPRFSLPGAPRLKRHGQFKVVPSFDPVGKPNRAENRDKLVRHAAPSGSAILEELLLASRHRTGLQADWRTLTGTLYSMNDCQTARGACRFAVRMAGAVCFDQCAGYAYQQVDHPFLVVGYG